MHSMLGKCNDPDAHCEAKPIGGTMSTPHMDEPACRKRKRQSIDTSVQKGQRCIDQFFSPGPVTCPTKATVCCPHTQNDKQRHVSHESSSDGVVETNSSKPNPSVQEQPERKPQTGPQQLPEDTSNGSISRHQQSQCQRPGVVIQAARALSQTRNKALPHTSAPVSGRAPTTGSLLKSSSTEAGHDLEAQERLFEDLALFQTMITDRQQFRE